MIAFYTIAAAVILIGAGLVAGCLSDNKGFRSLFANAERINTDLRERNKELRNERDKLFHELMTVKGKLAQIGEVFSKELGMEVEWWKLS